MNEKIYPLGPSHRTFMPVGLSCDVVLPSQGLYSWKLVALLHSTWERHWGCSC